MCSSRTDREGVSMLAYHATQNSEFENDEIPAFAVDSMEVSKYIRNEGM